MTQDAPLDQKALEAVARIIWADFAARYSGGDFPGLDSDLVAAQQVAATSRAILNALSRRVTASGGEADELPTLSIEIGYTNHRGEWAVRKIVPRRVWWGSTEWHPEHQWLLKAWDVEKRAERDFALKDFGPIVAAPEGWPIKLDMVTSSQFVARVQSDALTTIALPMIEELSKRPQTVWGDIVKALRSKAEELWEGKAEPVIWLQFNATDGFDGLRRWTRDKAQAERWMAEDDAGKYRFEAYSARIDLTVKP